MLLLLCHDEDNLVDDASHEWSYKAHDMKRLRKKGNMEGKTDGRTEGRKEEGTMEGREE
jgi:hypothetical protein